MKIKIGCGQDSHAFDHEDRNKTLILGGIVFKNAPPLRGNSDADVVLHALTNAISNVTGVNILGEISDDLCQHQGITDSKVYLKKALEFFKGSTIDHVSISIEGKRPRITPRIAEMKVSLAQLLNISSDDVGITATSGEGLTAFGRGEGLQAWAMITTSTKG